MEERLEEEQTAPETPIEAQSISDAPTLPQLDLVDEASLPSHVEDILDTDHPPTQRNPRASSSTEDQENQFFQCNICFDPVTQPVVTLCGHLFWYAFFVQISPTYYLTRT